MKVVLLALSFPKMEKVKYLYFGLVTEFHENGHEITVVAPAYDKNITGVQIEEGIKVLRVKTMPLFGVGLIKKGLANILLPYQYKRSIKKHKLGTDYDLIITPTPPISLHSVVAWLKKRSKAKTYLVLRDIFPQNAVDLGLMKSRGLFHYFFRRKERKLYAVSDFIGCMSQGNISFVKKQNPKVNKKKLHLLPNWADVVPLATDKEIFELRKKEGLENKFVIIFGGNIGLPQKLENIVNLAEACLAHEEFIFLIMGNGSERQSLEKLVASKSLRNLQLRDGLPQSEYMKWVQMADVGLISLSEKFTIPNIPSKALSYYNTKTPILASIDMNTDFGKILEDLNTGLWAEAGNTRDLKEKLMILYHDEKLRMEMGENGYNYMKEYLSSYRAYTTVVEQILA